MKALSIALKDIRLALQDPGTWVSLFLLPLLFIFIFSGGLGALAGENGDEETGAAQMALPVVNRDEERELSQALLGRLEASGAVVLQPLTQAEADQRLDTQEIYHVLVIPEEFTASFAAGIPSEVRLINHLSADAGTTEALRLAVDGAVQDLVLEEQLVASLEQMGAMQGASVPEQAFSTERIVAQAESQFVRAQTQPLVTVSRVDPGQSGEEVRETSFLGVQVFVPGFAVLFIFLAAQTTARSIYDEKKEGTFRRLLAGPIGKSSLLAGKLLPNLILALIQFAVIFAVAIFILPLVGLDRLNLGNDPLALILLCVLVALCSTTLGILIAAVARTENQIGGISTVVIWGAGILGGAMIPTFLISDLLDKIGRVVPHYWAVDGFYELLVLGGGLADIALPLAALAAFTLLFFAAGVWRFDYR